MTVSALIRCMGSFIMKQRFFYISNFTNPHISDYNSTDYKNDHNI